MFQYAFFRIYSTMVNQGDINPSLSAVTGWAFYVGVMFSAVLALMVHVKGCMVCDLMLAHSGISAIAVGASLGLFAYFRWVKTNAIVSMQKRFMAESTAVKQFRELLFWLWLIAVPVMVVGVRYYFTK